MKWISVCLNENMQKNVSLNQKSFLFIYLLYSSSISPNIGFHLLRMINRSLILSHRVKQNSLLVNLVWSQVSVEFAYQKPELCTVEDLNRCGDLRCHRNTKDFSRQENLRISWTTNVKQPKLILNLSTQLFHQHWPKVGCQDSHMFFYTLTL